MGVVRCDQFAKVLTSFSTRRKPKDRRRKYKMNSTIPQALQVVWLPILTTIPQSELPILGSPPSSDLSSDLSASILGGASLAKLMSDSRGRQRRGTNGNEYAPQPFAYEYGGADKDGRHFAKTESNEEDGVVTGEYRVELPDGRVQIVSYRADPVLGYQADVRYEGEARPEPEYNEDYQQRKQFVHSNNW